MRSSQGQQIQKSLQGAATSMACICKYVCKMYALFLAEMTQRGLSTIGLSLSLAMYHLSTSISLCVA